MRFFSVGPGVFGHGARCFLTGIFPSAVTAGRCPGNLIYFVGAGDTLSR